jgi:hypothetical protein
MLVVLLDTKVDKGFVLQSVVAGEELEPVSAEMVADAHIAIGSVEVVIHVAILTPCKE